MLLSMVAMTAFLIILDRGVAAAHEGWLYTGTFECDQTEYFEAAAQNAEECTAACSKESTPGNDYAYAEFNLKRKPSCRCYLHDNPCDEDHYEKNAEFHLYESVWNPDFDNQWVFVDHKLCNGPKHIEKPGANFQDLCTKECKKADKDVAVVDMRDPNNGRCFCATQADCQPGEESKGVNRLRMSSQQHGYKFDGELNCAANGQGDIVAAKAPVEDCLKHCRTKSTSYAIFDGRDASRPQCKCSGLRQCESLFEEMPGVHLYHSPEFQAKTEESQAKTVKTLYPWMNSNPNQQKHRRYKAGNAQPAVQWDFGL